jgi:hypothetical protein
MKVSTMNAKQKVNYEAKLQRRKGKRVVADAAKHFISEALAELAILEFVTKRPKHKAAIHEAIIRLEDVDRMVYEIRLHV